MAGNMILLLSIFSSVLFFFVTSQNQQNNNDDLLVHELRDAKLKISRLESVLEDFFFSFQNIDAKIHYLEERKKSLEDMTNKIAYLQSALSNLKDLSLLADERIKPLLEEVRLLWAVSRKNNFDLHVLESKGPKRRV